MELAQCLLGGRYGSEEVVWSSGAVLVDGVSEGPLGGALLLDCYGGGDGLVTHLDFSVG